MVEHMVQKWSQGDPVHFLHIFYSFFYLFPKIENPKRAAAEVNVLFMPYGVSYVCQTFIYATWILMKWLHTNHTIHIYSS